MRENIVDYNSFREKIYCIEKRRLAIYILLSLIIFSLLQIAIVNDSKIVNDFISAAELIIIMILLMFAIHLKSISKREIYGVIQIFLFTICIISIIFLTPKYQFQEIKIFLSRIGYGQSSEFYLLNIIMMYYMIAKYRNIENNSDVYFEYLILFGVVLSITFINNVVDATWIYYLYITITGIFLINIYRYLDTFNFFSESKIDLFKLNVNMAAISFIARVLGNYMKLYIITDSISIVRLIIFVSSIFAIIVNITKENYNFIFKETINTNKKLEELNKEIIYNNYELENAYRKLSNRQNLYKGFLMCLPNPIVIINNNLRISYCNEKFLSIIGKDNLREVVNRRIDYYINFNCDIRKIVRDINKKPYSTTIDKDDKKIEARFFSLNEEEAECILLLKDLTEEIKITSMKEELKSIKMKEEIKKNFLSNISHDLKVPINVIYSAIQLEKILIENNDTEKLSSYNEISKQNCFILTKLTNNLIDISKIDSENLEANLVLDNIVEFVEDYLFSLSPYIKNNGLNVLFDTDEEEIFICFDKEMMQRVILNLVANSLKFTDEGGTFFINIKNTKDEVLIKVGDTGIGMSKSFTKRAFNKYEKESRSKDSNSSGFGVGLFVVYNLIKAQNGNIEIMSDLGKGTIFTIKFNK
jgi:signal transduction histidine kinase